MNGSRLRWWHIVSGEEKDLSQLELEWGRVQIQMSWKLEPCYKWSDDAHPPFQESQTQEGD